MDKVSELQSLLDFVGEQMYISIGHLQENAAPVPLSPTDRLQAKHDAIALQGVNPAAVTELAQNIVKTIKLMDGHISALPTEYGDTIPQDVIQKLEDENRLLGEQIMERMSVAEAKIQAIREVLSVLARDRSNSV